MTMISLELSELTPASSDKVNFTLDQARALLHYLYNNNEDKIKHNGKLIGLTLGAIESHYSSYNIKESDDITIINTVTNREFSFTFTQKWLEVAKAAAYSASPRQAIHYLEKTLNPHFDKLLLQEANTPQERLRTSSNGNDLNEGQKLIADGWAQIAKYKAERRAQQLASTTAKPKASTATATSEATTATTAVTPVVVTSNAATAASAATQRPAESSKKSDPASMLHAKKNDENKKKSDKPAAKTQSEPPKKSSWRDWFCMSKPAEEDNKDRKTTADKPDATTATDKEKKDSYFDRF